MSCVNVYEAFISQTFFFFIIAAFVTIIISELLYAFYSNYQIIVDDFCTEEMCLNIGCLIIEKAGQVIFALGITIFSIIKSILNRIRLRNFRLLNPTEENRSNEVGSNPPNDQENLLNDLHPLIITNT